MEFSSKQIEFLKKKGYKHEKLTVDDMDYIVSEMALRDLDHEIDIAGSIITTITTSKEWLE